jgi:hypothetical protein
MPSSGLLRRVALVVTFVSKEYIASIFRVNPFSVLQALAEANMFLVLDIYP